MAWIVKLVSIGAEGEEHSTDVMRIARPDDLADLATLGLSLAEGKRLLAGVQPPCRALTHLDFQDPSGPSKSACAVIARTSSRKAAE